MLLTLLMSASIATVSPLAQNVPAAAQDRGIVVTGEANKKNKRVCKRSASTGSIMQKVTCRTVGEWEAENIRNEIALERMRTDQRISEAEQWNKRLAGH